MYCGNKLLSLIQKAVNPLVSGHAGDAPCDKARPLKLSFGRSELLRLTLSPQLRKPEGKRQMNKYHTHMID